MTYYFTADGKNIQGPSPLPQIAAWVREGRLPARLMVCEGGGQEWKRIDAVVPAIQLAQSASQAQSVQAQNAQAQAQNAQVQTAAAPVQAATQTHPATAAGPAQAQALPAETAPARSVSMQDGSAQAAPLRASRPIEAQVQPASAALTVRSEADFAELQIASRQPVNAKDHVSKGTTLHTIIALLVVLVFGTLGLAYLAVLTLGIGLVVMLVFYWLGLRAGHARIHGGAVHVTREQFPEIHRCTQDFAERLGMKSTPEIYVIEGSVLNAFAAKLGKRKYVLLLDDIVHGCLLAGETKALAFIIGHELAHHALGHTGILRGTMASTYKPLSRCDELSCDAVAAELVEDKEACARGLGLLLVGPQLVGRLNWRALDRQASELMSKKIWKRAEGSMSHPLLLRRYSALRNG